MTLLMLCNCWKTMSRLNYHLNKLTTAENKIRDMRYESWHEARGRIDDR